MKDLYRGKKEEKGTLFSASSTISALGQVVPEDNKTSPASPVFIQAGAKKSREEKREREDGVKLEIPIVE